MSLNFSVEIESPFVDAFQLRRHTLFEEANDVKTVKLAIGISSGLTHCFYNLRKNGATTWSFSDEGLPL